MHYHPKLIDASGNDENAFDAIFLIVKLLLMLTVVIYFEPPKQDEFISSYESGIV